MDQSVIHGNRERLLKSIPLVNRYIDKFDGINFLWSGAITAGMIETGGMVVEAAKLFSPLIQDMGATKARYGETQKKLVDAILFEMVKKTVLEIEGAAKFAINILKRNLFERTADVGYLATDAEIMRFLKLARDEMDSERIAQAAGVLRRRLEDYRCEYTVYNEILVLDGAGQVLANLDPDNPVRVSSDPLLVEALTRQGDVRYVETYGETDLRPDQGEVLLYSQKFEEPGQASPLGVLCLGFNFRDEMAGIFRDLNQGNPQIIVALLDEGGRVLVSSQEVVLPASSRVPVDLDADFRFLTFQGRTYLASMVATDGYQGFYGLTWYAMGMVDLEKAFMTGSPGNALDQALGEELQNLSTDLAAIRQSSEELLDSMNLDGINGQVKASRFQAKGFVEILHFVKWIGEELDSLFASAIRDLQDTVLASLLNDIQFRAFQGNNIADRNLYERANDVCWWALTPRFRQLLTKHRTEPMDEAERRSLTADLQYINNLYTPYLRLVMADTEGVVVAVSEPPEGLQERVLEAGLPRGQEFVGLQLDGELVRRTLGLASSRDYCVSGFLPTPLYGGRATYIYSTAVRDPDDEGRNVGLIQVVFDAEPQFRAMLNDILPKDDNKQALDGSFAAFADRGGKVIASTHPGYLVGSHLPLDEGFFQLRQGERRSAIVDLEGASYALGLQISEGYREYKRDDGYINDVVCLVFVSL